MLNYWAVIKFRR